MFWETRDEDVKCSFSADIKFADGTSRTIDKIGAEEKTYNEIKCLHPAGLLNSEVITIHSSAGVHIFPIVAIQSIDISIDIPKEPNDA